jgi:hypothetical protein
MPAAVSGRSCGQGPVTTNVHRPNKPVRPTHQPNPVVNYVLPGEEGNASVPVFVKLILEFTAVAVAATILLM